MVRGSLEIGNSNQELMEKSKRKKWKVWLSALILFIIIIILVAVAIVLLSGSEEHENHKEHANHTESSSISLDAILNGKLLPNRFNASWVSDTQLMFVDSNGSLIMYNVETKEKKELLTKDHQIMRISFDHQVSPDQRYILFAYNYQKVYRHSYFAQYLVIDIESGEQIIIHPKSNESFLELAMWGPQGNSIIYVKNSNIYYKSNISVPYEQLTNDGLPGIVYNGVPDWVYEEEIFASNKALWFSEDGSHLAYAKFNDSLTRVMTIPFYGRPGDIDFQYVRSFSVRYPKAGTANPDVSLYLVNLSGDIPQTVQLQTPNILNQPILASVSFVNNFEVAAVWTNRIQNEFIILICGEYCKEILYYKEEHGWVDMLRPLMFNSNGDKFFIIHPKKIGQDSWRQIAEIYKSDNENWTLRYMTNQTNTVTELVHWDESSQKMWYLATSVNDSAFQHLYSASLNGDIDCFTCKIEHSTGDKCLYNEASLSKKGSYVVVSCLGPQVPETYLYSKNGSKLGFWEKNEEIVEELKKIALPVVNRMMVQVAPKPLPPAQVMLLTPADADLSGNVKYPMLVNVYAGPDSFMVLEKWNLDWGASLVSRYNMIIAHIDGRGSGLKGNNNLFAGYRQLGSVEIVDQINVTRKLQKELGYIDPNRTCIWGWSYGGYASASALSHGGDTFKCAISVAPVTDWLYYDSMYTERYMGLPTKEDNYDGYLRAQLNTQENIMALGKKKFMLVHGTLDDNVHFQQSAVLARILQLNDVLFTQVSYPDEDHGLNNVKKHFYHSIEQFLKQNLLTDAKHIRD